MFGPAGEMVRNVLQENLKLKPIPPIFCPNCVKPIAFDSYVLSRPDEGHCSSCAFTWSDLATYDPMCVECGYSADHREGLGCRLERPVA